MATTPPLSVTECLEKARAFAAHADAAEGDEKARLAQLSREWLRLADEAAKAAVGNATS